MKTKNKYCYDEHVKCRVRTRKKRYCYECECDTEQVAGDVSDGLAWCCDVCGLIWGPEDWEVE